MAPSTDQGIIYPAQTDLRRIARDFKRLADSVNVPVSVLMNSVLGEGVVDATDPVVAALLGSGVGTNPALDLATADHIANPESATGQLLTETFMPASAALDQQKRAYRKQVKLALPFKSPDYAAMRDEWGDHYPQAFAVDEVRREMFVCSRARAAGGETTGIVVAVYDWDTGAYKSSFGVATSHVSAGAAVRWVGASRSLYLRVGQTTLGRFAITALPTNLATVTPTATLEVGLGRAEFAYADGTFTIADNTAPYGDAGARSKGQYKRVDADSLATTGYFLVDETLAGGNAYAYSGSVLPKSQGLADCGGHYALSIGGFWDASGPVDAYSYQGIRLISPGGDVLVDALMNPSKMVTILEDSAGLNPTRMENEGVQVVDGKVYTLTCTRTYSGSGNSWPGGEGLVIFEEFSDHPDAIDFSPAAATWTMPPITRLQSGVMPRVAGALRNLLTGDTLDSLPEIFEYMIAVNQSVFRFNTTLHTVLDVEGTPLSTGMVANIYNSNSYSFWIELTGTYPTLLHCFPDDVGGWNQRIVLQDTPWEPLTITSPLATGWYSPSYRRLGREVQLDGAVQLSGHNAEEFYTVATLPPGFLPGKSQFYPVSVIGTLQTISARLQVEDDGQVGVLLSSSSDAAVPLTGVRFTRAGL